MRSDPGGVFESDEHRRVCGNLGQPRSLASLQRELFVDPNVRLDEGETLGILKDLQADGDVKCLGVVADGDALVSAAEDDPDAITLEKEMADTLRTRATAKPHLYVEGEQWVLTSAGLGKLTAEHPDAPPPLTGLALRAALETNVQLAQGALDAEYAGGEDRTPEQVKLAEQTLARQQEALDAFEKENS